MKPFQPIFAVPYRSHIGGERKNRSFVRDTALCSYCSYLIYIYILLLHHRARSAKALEVWRSRWERRNNPRKAAEISRFCRSIDLIEVGTPDLVGTGA